MLSHNRFVIPAIAAKCRVRHWFRSSINLSLSSLQMHIINEYDKQYNNNNNNIFIYIILYVCIIYEHNTCCGRDERTNERTINTNKDYAKLIYYMRAVKTETIRINILCICEHRREQNSRIVCTDYTLIKYQ